jgi:hypothetical protein
VSLILTLFPKWGCDICKLVAIPLKMNLHLSKTQSLHIPEEVEAMSYVPYQQAIDFSTYAMVCIQPNLMFIIG